MRARAAVDLARRRAAGPAGRLWPARTQLGAGAHEPTGPTTMGALACQIRIACVSDLGARAQQCTTGRRRHDKCAPAPAPAPGPGPATMAPGRLCARARPPLLGGQQFSSANGRLKLNWIHVDARAVSTCQMAPGRRLAGQPPASQRPGRAVQRRRWRRVRAPRIRAKHNRAFRLSAPFGPLIWRIHFRPTGELVNCTFTTLRIGPAGRAPTAGAAKTRARLPGGTSLGGPRARRDRAAFGAARARATTAE